MEIKFFSGFYKKENSTKQPNLSNPTKTLTGYLIEPCSMMNPVFKIERLPSDASPCSYTYAYILEFERYYFVRDWAWHNGVWQCMLDVDVMASFKGQLATRQEYILRTDTTNNPLDFNEDVSDTLYPTTTNFSIGYQESPASLVTHIEDGIFIVGLISGNNQNSVGSITYYAMNSYVFGLFNSLLFSDTNMQRMGIINSQGQQLVQDVSKEVLKTLYNPYQYVASCMYFPIPMGGIGSVEEVQVLKMGWWEYPANGALRIYAQNTQVNDAMFNFTLHPQSATRGKYLNYAPYSRRALIGRFGTVPLDSALFKPGDTIDIEYTIDLITGQCLVDIVRVEYYTQNRSVICQRHFVIGVPIQIAQVGVDYLGTAVNAVNTVVGTVASAGSQNIGGAVSTLTNGIYSTIKSAMPQLETSGTNGSFLAVPNTTKLQSVFYQIVDEDNEHMGRPVCGKRTLSTLSGYVLCAEGDVDLDCFDQEREQIKRHLTTGFFWE